MTEENRSFLYLDSEDYRSLHEQLTRWWAEQQGEPIPSYQHAKQAEVEALVQLPKGSFFGHAAYPTLAEKAAIIFYTINKKQMFLNGNKRMSTLALLVFLAINHQVLDVSADDLTSKALWLAQTESLEFPAVKEDLVRWINEHLRNVASGA